MNTYRNGVEPQAGDRVVYVGDDDRWVSRLPDGRPLWDVCGDVAGIHDAANTCIVAFDGRKRDALVPAYNLMKVGDS